MTRTTITTAWDDLEVEKLVDEAIASGATNIKKASMKLGPYNGFTGAQRVEADWKIKVAEDLGLIPKRKNSCCSICGKSDGRIDYHNEDYSRPLQTVAICQKHHMALHNRFRSAGYASSWQKLVEMYGDKVDWITKVDTLSPS